LNKIKEFKSIIRLSDLFLLVKLKEVFAMFTKLNTTLFKTNLFNTFVILLSFLFISCSNELPKLNYESYEANSLTKLNYLDTNQLQIIAKNYFLEGLKLQNQGLFAESIIDFNLAYELDNSPIIYYSIAKSLFELNRIDLALRYLEKLNSKKPNFIPALELTTDILFISNEIYKAIEIQEMIYNKVKTREKRLQLARFYEYINPEKSIKIYDEEFDNNEKLQYSKSLLKLYELVNDTNKTIEIYKLQFIQSANPKLSEKIINYYVKNKKFDSLIVFTDLVDKSLDYENNSSLYEFLLANFLNSYMDFKIPEKDICQQLINKIDNRFEFECEINLFAGFLSESIKTNSNYANTSNYFEKSLKNCKNKSDILSKITYFYLNQKDNTNFQKYMDLYSEFEATDYKYSYFNSLYYFEKKEYTKAKDFGLIANNLLDSNVILITHLGLIYDELNKFDSTEYYYKLALAKDSNFTLTLNNYAYSLATRDKDLETAKIMSQKAIDLDGDNPSFLDTYAWINFKLGNNDLALEYLLKALKLDNKSSVINEHLGDVYLKMNKKEEALKYYKNSFELDKNINVKKKIDELVAK